jgi:hypothetical protein
MDKRETHNKSTLKYILAFSLLLIVLPLLLPLVPAKAAVLNQYPTDDSYVSSGFPNANYGSEILVFTLNSSSSVWISYFKFNAIAFLSAPVVDFYFTTGPVDKSYVIDIWICNTSWSELSVTYNTRPSLFVKIGQVGISSVQYTLYSVSIKNYIADVVSIAIIAHYTGSSPGLLSIVSKDNTLWQPYISNDVGVSSGSSIGFINPIMLVFTLCFIAVAYLSFKQRPGKIINTA